MSKQYIFPKSQSNAAANQATKSIPLAQIRILNTATLNFPYDPLSQFTDEEIMSEYLKCFTPLTKAMSEED